VFHLRHAGHCPSHFGLECPHSAQAYTVRAVFAAGRGIAGPYRATLTPRPEGAGRRGAGDH
jgi:hypothetical protein